MHIGSDGTFKDSKTEAVVFLLPGMGSSMFDTSPVPVLDGYITYTNRFKYLGSYITSELSDTHYIKNHVVQANKAMASMMMEVQMYRLSNEFLYKEFCIDPTNNIMASRQLRWLGKIALMEETRLPRKFIGAWHVNPHPIRRPQQTIRHTYLSALCLMGAISTDDKQGNFATWFPQATNDPKEWEARRKLLTPNLIGRKEKDDDQMRNNN
eukprot:12396825-Ditylum_brightwellii.AAC.1